MSETTHDEIIERIGEVEADIEQIDRKVTDAAAETRSIRKLLWWAIPALAALSGGTYAFARADLDRHVEREHHGLVTRSDLDAHSAGRDARLDDLARRLDRIERKLDKLMETR